MPVVKNKSKKAHKEISIIIERQRRTKEKEIKKYGRSWKSEKAREEKYKENKDCK